MADNRVLSVRIESEGEPWDHVRVRELFGQEVISQLFSFDVDVVCDRLFEGYRQKPAQPAVIAAEAALRGCGYKPRRIASGGGSDANALVAKGLPCVNLANGTERNHEPTERVSVVALEGMLDVTLRLLDEAALA